MEKKIKQTDIVTLVLSILLLISFLLPSFVSFLKTRVNMPEAVSAHEAFGFMYWIMLAVILFFVIISFIKKESQLLNFIVGMIANLFLAFIVFYTAARYDALPFEHTASSRMSFGVGFVMSIITLYGITVVCAEKIKNKLLRVLNGYTCWVLIAIMLFTGLLDNYAVMQEYAANAQTFGLAVEQHITLCLKSIAIAIVIGVPTGYLCYRHKIADKLTIFILSIFETMPMMALYALIRIPCTSLGDKFPALARFGIGSHGISVSVIALVLYALYLIVLNSRAAFATVDKEYIETALAMGMSERRAFIKIQMPLALPIVLAGIRLALINTFTAAALASMFGGGGLGRFINLGINGNSIDCQLLAVIPIFVLTMIADLLMKGIINLSGYFTGGRRYDKTAKCV